jgi:8-oxo-dGTP diphosphatase
MKTSVIVVGVLKFKSKILILHRTSARSSSPNLWQPVSGYIEERESAEDAVLREVKEETGLTGKIVKSGKIFEVADQWGRWIIVPYLIEAASDDVNIDLNEHSEYKWIDPKEIVRYDIVKGVLDDLKSLGIL